MAQTMLFRNARLIDGLADQPREGVSILSVAARYWRQQDNRGSVAPGRYADFLVVDGDPLRAPRELRKLTTVYRGGVAHDPQAILAKAPKSDAVQTQ